MRRFSVPANLRRWPCPRGIAPTAPRGLARRIEDADAASKADAARASEIVPYRLGRVPDDMNP